jgi:N-acetylglucosamine kinase-like BadF-type ATPase
MAYFIGFDVGSSKTHALVVDEHGQCHGFGQAWGGNQQSVGYEGLVNVLGRSFEQASRMAHVSAEQIKGAGFGIAGYDFPSDRAPHLEAIASLGFSCPLELTNDGCNGVFAGTTRGIGASVTAGSGVNCRGRGPDGREGRIVGNGMTFGEFGGGIEIVWKGLHMVNYAWMKRIPPTALTAIYLDESGARDELDLMHGLSKDHYHFSPYVAVRIFEAARAGDAAAREVIRFSGEELGWLAVSVIRQIGMENSEVEVVQSGSVFNGGELIDEPMRRILLQHVPGAKIKRLDCLPVIGPVILGMMTAGVDGYAVRVNMVNSAKELIKET